ncbi:MULTISPECIES: sensor histidine kinase [Chitinophagaceae]
MKFLQLSLILTLLSFHTAQSQNRIPDSYKRIGNTWVDSTSPDFKYLRWNGRALVDVRKMTPEEKTTLSGYERIIDIQNDGRFPNAYWSFQDYGSSIQIGYPSAIKDTLFAGGKGVMGTIIQAQLPVEFAAVNITPQNADQYLYHIIEDGQKEIVHWQKPANFITTKDGKYQYAYLGKYASGDEKYLSVEIYNVNNYKDHTECTVDWRKIKPFKTESILVQYMKQRDPTIYSSILQTSGFEPFIETKNDKDCRIRMGDSLINITCLNHDDLPYAYKVEVKKEDKNIFMDVSKGEIKIPYNVWNVPGKYVVTIAPRLPTRYWAGQTSKQMGRDIVMNQYATSFSFTVLPPLHQKFSFSRTQLISFFAGLAMFVFLIWWYVRQKAKLKIVEANFQKEKNVLELASLRNHLNPHFIFNAITSIQNLILKNENTAANMYLAKLGKITRNVLDNSGQELISIDSEMKLLTEYMEMEQLRFGFQFAIHVDDNLDREIEIPAMLLQPLVENAIKHGISSKKALGNVHIDFKRTANDICIQIIDNGGNVQSFSNPDGYGIDLVRKRMKLINQANKEKTIEMRFSSDATKTIACITLHQWI